jgi:hypothetical protein
VGDVHGRTRTAAAFAKNACIREERLLRGMRERECRRMPRPIESIRNQTRCDHSAYLRKPPRYQNGLRSRMLQQSAFDGGIVSREEMAWEDAFRRQRPASSARTGIARRDDERDVAPCQFPQNVAA